MKKLLQLKAIQMLKGDAAATEEILKALRRTDGNMRKACELLGIGKSSMYRLIDELGAKQAVDELIASKGYRLKGKVRASREDPESAPRSRARTSPRAAEAEAVAGARSRSR